jgi:hypothetical protein
MGSSFGCYSIGVKLFSISLARYSTFCGSSLFDIRHSLFDIHLFFIFFHSTFDLPACASLWQAGVGRSMFIVKNNYS